MRQVRHRNVCKYIDSFSVNGNKLFIVMEYCDRGDLGGYLQRMREMAKSVVVGQVIQ